ncbi:glycosyltransferase family 4 protein [Clostridium botulinum]|nr:glycosyltransferase family 4 protein [Clostridium botulinum]NFP01071.1 glycosyltransferase family 4 protein [Clostridium botulinum]
MKINFLNGNLIIRKNKSGVHFFHENIMRGLIKNGINLKTSFFNFTNKNTLLLEEKENNWIKDNIIQNKYLPRILTYILPIEFFFGKSDIYICDGWIPITICKSKKIAIVHDLMSKIYPENYSLIMKLYLSLFFVQVKKADRIIAVSDTTKKDIIKYLNISANKIDVVYNGVNLKYIKSIESDKSRININLNRKYILYIGEMRKNKNLISAIKAFELYCSINDDKCYFYIAGKKSYEYENIINYIKNKPIKNRIIFLGYISEKEKIKLYKNSFAFIFISLYEGFGIPILEAMACKTPVITSDCSSMKEIADGSALLVSPTNINEICKMIEKLNDERFRKNIIKLGNLCVKKYQWKDSVSKFEKILIKTKDIF